MKDTILSLTRHILTATGALLVSKGIVDDGTVQAAIGGILAIVGFFLFRSSKLEQ